MLKLLASSDTFSVLVKGVYDYHLSKDGHFQFTFPKTIKIKDKKDLRNLSYLTLLKLITVINK